MELASPAPLVPAESTAIPTTFRRGHSERCWEGGSWQAEQALALVSKSFPFAWFFFPSFNPSAVLESTQSRQATRQLTKNKPE